jgi:hypothetical protein
VVLVPTTFDKDQFREAAESARALYDPNKYKPKSPAWVIDQAARKLRNLAKAAESPPALDDEIRHVATSLEALLTVMEDLKNAARLEVIEDLEAEADHIMENAKNVMGYSVDEGRARELVAMTLRNLLPLIKMRDDNESTQEAGRD